MFIKSQAFKSMAKKAWKREDLLIAHCGGYYIIGFGWCQMQVLDTHLTNKLKAILVELTGELPPEGEGYIYGEGCEPQTHLDVYDNLFDEFEKYEDRRCEATCMMVRRCGSVNIVMQEKAAVSEKFMVNEALIQMVDIGQIEESRGEYDPGLPVVISSCIAWGNNVMVLKIPITPIKYDTDKTILSITEDMSPGAGELLAN